MKKINYIGLFAMLLLFSCSKEQPLQPINTGDTYTPSMITISNTEHNTDSPTKGDKSTTKNSDDDKNKNSDSNDDITDPEKGDGKGKSNKKAKN